MRSGFLVAILAAALLAPLSSARADDEANLKAALDAVFAPYRADDAGADAAWDRPVFSAETAALIAEWEKGLSDEEVEDLNGFDWFCQCQDFDQAKFAAHYAPFVVQGLETATVDVRVDRGFDDDPGVPGRFHMVKEGGRWLLDDIVSESFPDGLKAELRKAIEEHRKQGR